MLLKSITFLFLSIKFGSTDGYRILGVFPLSGKSHDMIFRSLMVGLSNRGHQVDVVTHFPMKNPPKNYTTIISLEGAMERLVNNFTMDFVNSFAGDEVDLVSTVYGNRLCHFMGLDHMQKLIHNPPQDPPYDVVITEVFGAHCYLGLGHHLGVPVVGVSSAIEYPWISTFTGNSDNLAFVPNALIMAFGKMNFWKRLENLLVNFDQVRRFQKHTEVQTELMRKYLNPNIPDIREVEKSVALFLVNSHPVLFGVKPVTSALIPIAGLHVEESTSKMSKELKKWMDESTHGVIYFTFGSMVLVETLDKPTLLSFYASFAKIAPIRVLTKIADPSKLPPGLPDNVKMLPWVPQQPVLAHKNTKAFITHGGLMGSLEAMYYGVPMIGIPLFADQPRNVESFGAKNMSIKLLLKDVNEKTLDTALNTILKDPKYRESAHHFSRLLRDRPMSAMDTANYWIEYVIRNGAKPLRSPALDLEWYELALLDVYAFIALVILVMLAAIYVVLKFVLRFVSQILLSDDDEREKKFK